MGVEEGWQQVLSRHRPPLLHRPLRDDRGNGSPRRAWLMLVAGAVLGLAAMFISRSQPGNRVAAARPAIATTRIVAAAAEIGFGERLTPENLKLVDVPARALPAGHFAAIELLLREPGQTAIRPIGANEIITAGALVAGATRLSAAPLLGQTMRALSVPVDDVTGISGLVTPGDRVDVMMTRQPDEAMPHAELLAQNIRVLAVGTDMNIARDKPAPIKSATLELTPAQTQKIALALTAGRLSLALRQFSDTGRIQLQSLQVSDLTDGTISRLIRKPGAASPPSSPPSSPSGSSSPPPGPSPSSSIGVVVMRGSEAARVPVMP